MTSKTCAQCAIEFAHQVDSPHHRFCGARCSDDWWNAARLRSRSCTHCGSDMTGWPRTARVCSDLCRTERKRQTQKEADARRRVPIGPGAVTCQQCGDDFHSARPSVSAFCSAWCQAASRTYVEGTRDRWRMWADACYICQDPAEATDHVKPRAAGGLNLASNLRPICGTCNATKRHQWLGTDRLPELISKVAARSAQLKAA